MQLRYVYAILFFCLIFLLTGCANPLNRATSDRYMQQCFDAEKQGNLSVAEQACYRSLVNVDMGHLGPELKSQRLYELGRIKRRLGKYEEAEDLFIQSLEIEEKLTGPSSRSIARRLMELALSYLEETRVKEGIPLITRLETMISMLSEKEKNVVGGTFYFYSKELYKRGNEEMALSFEQKSKALGFVPPES